MDYFLDLLTSFTARHPWVPLAIGFYLASIKLLQGLKDSIDKTPGIDTNWFERTVTILGKTLAYLTIAKRPEAPKAIVEEVGVVANAVGVPVAQIEIVPVTKEKIKAIIKKGKAEKINAS